MQTRVLHSAVGYFCIAVFLSPVVVATFIRVVFANLYIAKIKKRLFRVLQQTFTYCPSGLLSPLALGSWIIQEE